MPVPTKGKLPRGREKPPLTIREKGELPTARKMDNWVLVALQELGGEAQFRQIDAKVGELLARSGVLKKELNRKIKHTRKTSANLKTSGCRTALKKRGLLERTPAKKGRWSLTASGETQANFWRTKKGLPLPKAPTVNKLATDAGIKPDALAVLRDNNVPEEVLEKFLEQLVSTVSIRVETGDPPKTPSNNLAVEKAAINFIQDNEKGWHTTPPNNEGFDLYRTQSGRKNGKKTVWCEVKSLSGEFTGVSLTHPEFKKAQECGDAYWLYIVENVDNVDSEVENSSRRRPTIIKINDPAGKVERFTYGSRWRNVAEKFDPNQEKLQL